MSIGIELDIGGTIVGVITLIVLAWQIHGQSSFSKRIADLEYIKLIEPKLLATLYKCRQNIHPNKSGENGSSNPSFDYYKFHFFMGFLVEPASSINNSINSVNGSRAFKPIYKSGELNKEYFNDKDKSYLEKYCEIYENAVKCIKTKDIKNTFVDSEFGEVFRVIKNYLNKTP